MRFLYDVDGFCFVLVKSIPASNMNRILHRNYLATRFRILLKIQLKYSAREKILSPFGTQKKKGECKKYFPFHLIFHSLNIEMEKLVEWNETWPEEFSYRRWEKQFQSTSQFRSASRTSRKGIFSETPSYISSIAWRTVDFFCLLYLLEASDAKLELLL